MRPPETSARRPAPQKKETVWNALTILLLLLTLGLVVFFLAVFINPYQALNPFPPQALPSPIVIPTATPEIFPPTWTPTPSPEPTATATPPPPAPTDTPVVLGPTGEGATPEPGETATLAAYPYSLRGTAVAVASTIIHSEQGCEWMGVGGQAFGMQGEPVVGLTIQLGGTLGGSTVSQLGLTGTVIQYGPAGYEFQLGEKPVASKQTLWVQLLDQAGLPLSSKVYFDTFNDCEKNLVLINFKQVR